MTNKKVMLQTKDLFKVLAIVRKTGVLSQLKETILKGNKIEAGLSDAEIARRQEDLGFNIVILIVENLDKAEDEIYELLANLSGKTSLEIQEQDPMETLEVLKEIMDNGAVKTFLAKMTV